MDRRLRAAWGAVIVEIVIMTVIIGFLIYETLACAAKYPLGG